MSARELDRLSEITEGHTSLIESGVVRDVGTQTLSKIAKVLGVSLDWLVTGQGKVPTARQVSAAVNAARGVQRAEVDETGPRQAITDDEPSKPIVKTSSSNDTSRRTG